METLFIFVYDSSIVMVKIVNWRWAKFGCFSEKTTRAALGGILMIFKRQEGFRHAFEEPLAAGVVILIEGKPLNVERSRIPCEILDISPRGLKILIGEDFSEYKNKVLQLEISFILDLTEITGIGEIVWSKQIGKCYYYGITFFNQPSLENLIVSELKIRRRKEISKAKLSN